jgi:hypothetical protein
MGAILTMIADMSPHIMKSICFALLLFVSIPGASAIDFTPRYAQSVQDGFPVNRLYFSDQARRIYLSVPNSWRVSGDQQHGIFTPGNLSQASVVLENSSLSAQVPFEREGLEAYRKAASELIPVGATEVQVDFERANEIQINGWTSWEMAFSYQFCGQRFTRSVLFINLNKEKQIRFRVEARKENFEKLYPQARAALGSWFAPSAELEAVLQRLSSKG